MLVKLRAVTPAGIALPAAIRPSRSIVRARRLMSVRSQGASNWRAKSRMRSRIFSGPAKRAAASSISAPCRSAGLLLGAPADRGAVRQHPGMAGVAAHRAELDLALLANHPRVANGNRPVGGHRHAGLLEETSGREAAPRRRRPARTRSARGRRSSPAAIQSAGVFSRAGSNATSGLALVQRLPVALRLAVGVVDGVGAMDHPLRDPVVVRLRDVPRETTPRAPAEPRAPPRPRRSKPSGCRAERPLRRPEKECESPCC
jgi:hypothetical protein